MILSIITTTKNDYLRLKKTIDSLKSIYRSSLIEHIIIDGNSKDDTKSYVKKYQKKYSNIIFKSEDDRGIYDGMNKGIALSSGSYLLFLNSGDEFSIKPNLILKTLKSCNKRQWQILCFPYLEKWGSVTVEKYPLRYTTNKLPTSHQAMIFSRFFIKKNMYNPRYRIAADFGVFLEAKPHKVKFLTDHSPLSIVEGEGVASNNPMLSYREYSKIAWAKYSLIKSINITIGFLFKAIARTILRIALSKKMAIKLRILIYETHARIFHTKK